MRVAAAMLPMLKSCLLLPVAMAAPHIVTLVSDDLGWSNIGFHNDAVISPHLDALHGEGIEVRRRDDAPGRDRRPLPSDRARARRRLPCQPR